MTQPSAQLLNRLRRAAELRASGLSWDVIAGRLKCKAATCSRWPTKYRDVWRCLLREAERCSEQDAGAEARAKLRVIIRGEDDKSSLAAAQHLLRSRAPKRRTPRRPIAADREMATFIAQIKEFSDEELEATLCDFLATNGATDRVAVTPLPPDAG